MTTQLEFRGVLFYFRITEQRKQHSALTAVKRFKRSPFLACFVAFLIVNTFGSRAQIVDSTYLFNLDIKFEGSNVNIDGNYQYILDNFVEYFLEHPEISIHVRGHVCCRPGKRISKLRARNVYRFLRDNGIDPSRMTYAGYSDTMPLASPERTEEDERVNRRVDFILTKK